MIVNTISLDDLLFPTHTCDTYTQCPTASFSLPILQKRLGNGLFCPSPRVISMPNFKDLK